MSEWVSEWISQSVGRSVGRSFPCQISPFIIYDWTENRIRKCPSQTQVWLGWLLNNNRYNQFLKRWRCRHSSVGFQLIMQSSQIMRDSPIGYIPGFTNSETNISLSVCVRVYLCVYVPACLSSVRLGIFVYIPTFSSLCIHTVVKSSMFCHFKILSGLDFCRLCAD